MSEINTHVYKYLNWYIRLKVKPGFAVMVKGPWGCGKTHLVRSFLDELDKTEEIKHLYVSLYGVSSKEEIEDQFMRQLHPVLTGRTAVLTGRLLRAALGVVRFDWDSSENTTVGYSGGVIPDSSIANELNKLPDQILVFDDIERCGMPLNEILGYINYLVEKEDFKAIVLADERKLEGVVVNGDSTYEEVVEKLIGMKLEVKPETLSVYNDCVRIVIKSSIVQKVLMKNMNTVVEIVDRSSHNNMRTLKKTIIDFGRLWDCLDNEHKNNEGVIRDLLEVFTILSCEIHSGELASEDIHSLLNGKLSRSMAVNQNRETDKDKNLAAIDRKYGSRALSSTVSAGLWYQFFTTGTMDKEALKIAIEQSPHLADKNTPPWIKIAHLYELKDEDFQPLIERVDIALNDGNITHPSHILTAAGSYLFYSRHGLLDKSVADIREQFCKYIERVFADHSMLDQYIIDRGDEASYAGILSDDSEEYVAVEDCLTDALCKAREKALSVGTPSVLEKMRNNPLELYGMLCPGYSPVHAFQRYPILEEIAPNTFVNEFIEIEDSKRATTGRAIATRYEHLEIAKQLAQEEEWLKSVLALLNQQLESRKGTVTALQLKSHILHFVKAISNIDEFRRRDEK